jgi:CheY-like chemotaxis protein
VSEKDSYIIGMARKSALVVDDSKSARVILSRMLEKYDIEVDMAESAEQAMQYLQSNRPDAIFMDHLMPGMDGLQAVQAIKGNPQTAMIPIMMYTSQEGELYVGQARALGAMGVLPKQVRPVDVSKVLYELHLLPDRRDMTEPALSPVEMQGGAAVDKSAATPLTGAGTSAAATASASNGASNGAASAASSVVTNLATNVDWGRRIETAVKDQSVDIRRFIVACLDSFATRIVSDVRDARPPSTVEALPPPPPPAPRPVWPWAAGIAAASLVAVAFAASWLSARSELAKSRAEVAGLASANAELQHVRNDLYTTVKDLTADLAGATGGTLAPGAGAGGGTSTLVSHVESVPYGEIPFDRARLDVLRDLLAKLEAQGFHGVVRITSLAGAFCLSGNPADGYTLAAAALPAAKCDLVGNPFEESLSGQQRQSLAFANLIAGVRQRTAGAITVAIESAGSVRAATPYPPKSDSLTAGEWNRAAAANNRVEFATEAAAP